MSILNEARNRLVFDPFIASMLGLNEAIVLQQINYWLRYNEENGKTSHFKDGFWWTYNSYEEWTTQFPFWSASTIKRAIKRLEDKGILISHQYATSRLDWSKWYTIDEKTLEYVLRSGHFDPID